MIAMLLYLHQIAGAHHALNAFREETIIGFAEQSSRNYSWTFTLLYRKLRDRERK